MGNYVNDVDSSFWQTTDAYAPPVAYAALDPDAAGNVLIDMRGMTKLTLYMMNGIGATINWQVLGSIDGGVSWDFTEKADAALTASTNAEHWWTNWLTTGGRVYTHLLLQTKSAGAAALTVKVSST